MMEAKRPRTASSKGPAAAAPASATAAVPAPGSAPPPEDDQAGTTTAAAETAATEEPRNARIIAILLRSMGVDECEPRVVHQLLEFMHRYVLDVFQESLVYADHAGRTDVTLDDVRLAIQAKVNYSFTAPPPREFLQELATVKNQLPLPVISERYGVYLPPDQHCLMTPNYRVLGIKADEPSAVTGSAGAPLAGPPPPVAPALPTARSLPTRTAVVRGRPTARPPAAIPVETEALEGTADASIAGAAAAARLAQAARSTADAEFEEVAMPSAAQKRGRDAVDDGSDAVPL